MFLGCHVIAAELGLIGRDRQNQHRGLRDDGWLDVNGAPFTAGAKITERFRRPTYGRMEIDVTIDDSKAYTRPWTVRLEQRFVADEDLLDEICLEGARPLHVAK